MAVLSQTQIRTLAILAGLPNPDLMAAIAMAESNGNTDAVGRVGEIGLWQINQPVHVKAHPSWTVSWLRNPANNAQAARTILNSQGLGAWTTYTSGAYKRFYAAGVAEQTSGIPGLSGAINGIGDVVGGAVDAGAQIGRLAQAVAKAGNWISTPANWVRIAYVVIGGAAIVGAMITIQSEESVKLAKQVVGVGAKFAGKGKVAA